MSTKLPFTVMLLLLVGAFLLAGVARGLVQIPKAKVVLSGLWLLSPFVLNWIVLRDPTLTMDACSQQTYQLAYFS